jgi:DNA-binding NtrC family response regulator
LLVDDDSDTRSVFREKLELSSYEVDEADCAETALGMLKEFDPDVVITDVRMDGSRSPWRAST